MKCMSFNMSYRASCFCTDPLKSQFIKPLVWTMFWASNRANLKNLKAKIILWHRVTGCVMGEVHWLELSFHCWFLMPLGFICLIGQHPGETFHSLSCSFEQPRLGLAFVAASNKCICWQNPKADLSLEPQH